MSANRIVLHVELTSNQAAAVFRLCDKFSHSDAKAFLYPHIGAGIRADQAYDMVGGVTEVQNALRDAGVTTAWPWLDTGVAS